MADKRPVDELTTKELEELLAVRRREERLRRLRRLGDKGRLVGLPEEPPDQPAYVAPPPAEPVGATAHYGSTPVEEEEAHVTVAESQKSISFLGRFPRVDLRWVANRFLLLVELIAILGLAMLIWDTWQTRQQLNREATEAHQQVVEETFPTAAPTAIFDVVILPGGHTSPIAEGGAREGEAGGIPDHLLPLVNAYKPPPIPTPGPEQAKRIVIPAIGVDHPVVEGDIYEQLKKGVGHHIGSADPGETGNLVLTAHNDIYGEIFRRLDELEVGDEITVYTLSQRFTYIVQSTRVVEKDEVSVLAPSRNPTVTLISCYPYLLDTQRIIIKGVLTTEL